MYGEKLGWEAASDYADNEENVLVVTEIEDRVPDKVRVYVHLKGPFDMGRGTKDPTVFSRWVQRWDDLLGGELHFVGSVELPEVDDLVGRFCVEKNVLYFVRLNDPHDDSEPDSPHN